MARAAINQPTSENLAVTTECAGDEIAAVRFHFESRRRHFTATRDKWCRKTDHDLADMFSARHETKCRIDARSRKRTIRKRPKHALFDQCGDFSQHLPCQFFVAV